MSEQQQEEPFVFKWSTDPCNHPHLSSSASSSSSELCWFQTKSSHLVFVSCFIKDTNLFSSPMELQSFEQAGHTARIALADLFVRQMMTLQQQEEEEEEDKDNNKSKDSITTRLIHSKRDDDKSEDDWTCSCHIASLDYNTTYNKNHSSRPKRKKNKKATFITNMLPYILERTDVYCTTRHLCVRLRITLTCDYSMSPSSSSSSFMTNQNNCKDPTTALQHVDFLTTFIQPNVIHYIQSILTSIQPNVLSHIAHALLQSYIRNTVLTTWDFTSTLVQGEESIKEEEEDESSSLSSLSKTACITLDDIYKNKTNKKKEVIPGAVAFIANGSILPRKSGNSTLPMNNNNTKQYHHVVVPFQAPKDSINLYRVLHIHQLGLFWTRFIQDDKIMKQEVQEEEEEKKEFISSCNDNNTTPSDITIKTKKTILIIPGMIIPKGITLICGGGFHGKSTLLRSLAMGIYNKIQGDGRELCITTYDAVSIRAEDGRYVNHCNITAFMSCIGQGGGGGGKKKEEEQVKREDKGESSSISRRMAYPTQHLFSTQEASGSTSQASNVIEAIEFGATALLMDEDVCAANFMARDGRMRALVKDETITPLLYRVNGLYQSRQISSVIVIGGIGDWLDVPDNVILMDKHYQVNDALQRARSISHQFSYNHIQYGGRGVVHRLEWKKYDDGFVDHKQSPQEGDNLLSFLAKDDINPRDRYIKNAQRFAGGALLVSQGGDSKFTITSSSSSSEVDDVDHSYDEDDDFDDDFGSVDLSKCEQIAGRIWQVVGCALAVKWLVETSVMSPCTCIKSLIESFELDMDKDPGGSFSDLLENTMTDCDRTVLINTGYALRPRKYEVASSIARLRGGLLLPVPLSRSEEVELIRQKEETDSKVKALADLWSQRR